MTSDGGSSSTFRVLLDSERCVGHGRCYELAPEVFGEDERGYSCLLHHEIPASLAPQAQSAEANCPEQAIRVKSP